MVTAVYAQQQQQQIIINKDNIKTLTSYGNYEIVNPDYIKIYNASLLFDNIQDGNSYWSDWGDSGWKLELLNPLENEVCSIEMGVLNPQNNIFSFKINNSTTTGILNNSTINFNLNPCLVNMTTMSMDINTNETKPTDTRWTSISEVKLFSNETIIVEPPTDPDENMTKILISDSKIKMTVNNSTIDLTLEDGAVINLPPNAFPPPPPPPQQIVEEEEEEEDKKDKKDKEDEEDDDKN